jgi:catechol 2,3-dioxygenase-like lactoylglutathione lyase family enzyme
MTQSDTSTFGAAKIMRARTAAILAICLGVLWQSPALSERTQAESKTGSSLVVGLDHIPIVVADLEAAVVRFRALGFALKPGRLHANGILNQHLKFPDGTQLELISLTATRDQLSREYARHLELGEGPVFAGFFTPELDRTETLLKTRGRDHFRESRLLVFPGDDPLRHLFFGGRNKSPSDQAKHFAHRNTATSLIGVWIAGADLAAERQLLEDLGASLSTVRMPVPVEVDAQVALFEEAEVVLLPESRQVVPGRPIIGATLQVRDLAAMQQIVHSQGWTLPPVVSNRRGSSLFVPPEIAFGIWLEFRQIAERDALDSVD